MSDSWSSDDAASPTKDRHASTVGFSNQRAKPVSSKLSYLKQGRAAKGRAEVSQETPSSVSAADAELRSTPPSAAIRTDTYLRTDSGAKVEIDKGSEKNSGRTATLASSSSDWDSSGDDDGHLAAELQKKFAKHQVRGLNKFVDKVSAAKATPEAPKVMESADPTSAPASALAAKSVPAATARALRSMVDTDATSAYSGAGPGTMLTHTTASNKNAKSSSSSSSSSSDWDDTSAQPLPSATPASLTADDTPNGARTGSADADPPAVRPPSHVQPLQFARRAVGVGGMSPRAAPPHASPRVNPSLTPRSTAAAKHNLHLSEVTDSSSGDELRNAEVPRTTTHPLGGSNTEQTQQQHKPDARSSHPVPTRNVSAQLPTAPGAIISRQPSLVEEDRQQHQIAQSSRPGRMRSSTAADAVSAPTGSPSAPHDEEEGQQFPEKVHTRCSRLIGVPLVCGLTGFCTGLALICLGIACFASKGSVCGPLGPSWGTVALIAFGIFLLLAFTGLLKSAYRIYRERWNFYKLQRYQLEQHQAEVDARQASSGRVPLDGLYFDSGQFFGNVQRAQGGGRALAPLQEEEEVSGGHGAATHSSAKMEAAAAVAADSLVGVGMGGRGVRVGGGMTASKGKA